MNGEFRCIYGSGKHELPTIILAIGLEIEGILPLISAKFNWSLQETYMQLITEINSD